MGGSHSNEEPKHEHININHPKFKDIRMLKDDDALRSNISIEHESDYEQWEQKLNKIANLDDQVILLPKAYQYTRRAICGSSGSIQIDYDNYPYILADELKNRQKVNRYFQQPEIWYLLYSLVTAAHDFQKINSKIGDVRPQNIFINEQGHIKVSNLYSWPAEVSNYVKCVYDNEKTYLAPEQAEAAKEGQAQTYINKFKAQSFSIGLTCLQSGLIRGHLDDLYYPNKTFNNQKFAQLIKQWWSLVFRSVNQQTGVVSEKQYSDALKLTVTALCDLQPQDRLISDQVYNWLKSFHKEINQLRPFQVGLPPIKNMNKYSQLLSNMDRNGQPVINSNMQGKYRQNMPTLVANPNPNINIGQNVAQYPNQYQYQNQIQNPNQPTNNKNAHFETFKNYANPGATGLNPPQVSPRNDGLYQKSVQQTFYNYSNPPQNKNTNQPQFQQNQSRQIAPRQQSYLQSQPPVIPNYNYTNTTNTNNFAPNTNLYKTPPTQNTTTFAPQTVSQYQPQSQPQSQFPSQYQPTSTYQPSSNYQPPSAPFILNQPSTSSTTSYNTPLSGIGIGSSQPYTGASFTSPISTGTGIGGMGNITNTKTTTTATTVTTTNNYSKPSYNSGNADFLKQIDQQILKSKQGFK